MCDVYEAMIPFYLSLTVIICHFICDCGCSASINEGKELKTYNVAQLVLEVKLLTLVKRNLSSNLIPVSTK